MFVSGRHAKGRFWISTGLTVQMQLDFGLAARGLRLFAPPGPLFYVCIGLEFDLNY